MKNEFLNHEIRKDREEKGKGWVKIECECGHSVEFFMPNGPPRFTSSFRKARTKLCVRYGLK